MCVLTKEFRFSNHRSSWVKQWWIMESRHYVLEPANVASVEFVQQIGFAEVG